MRRIRSHQDCGWWDEHELKLPSHFLREQAPVVLIKSYDVPEKIQPPLKFERVVRIWGQDNIAYVGINHEYVVAGLVDTFAAAFERAMIRNKSYTREEIAGLKARANAVMQDIVGRFLYLRLYNIALVEGFFHREDFGSLPRIDPNIELPTPLARAISNIGIFRPAGVVPETTFLPTYACDPLLAGGYKHRCQSRAYSKLFLEFAKCGISTSKVEIRNCDGTAWYLLGVRSNFDAEKDGITEVIATFPLEAGNISVTDAITRTFCLHGDRPWVCAGINHDYVCKYLYVDNDRHGSNFGTALVDVDRLTEPIDFMEVDMATKPEEILSARDREILDS